MRSSVLRECRGRSRFGGGSEDIVRGRLALSEAMESESGDADAIVVLGMFGSDCLTIVARV